MTPDKPLRQAPADPAVETGAERTWRIPDMSPAAVESARAAARRAGMPLAAWLAGLIEVVAERERAVDEAGVPPDAE
jgi:hypothetical protein